MRILISGATGFVGKPLNFYLQSKGHTTVKLVRTSEKESECIVWDVERREARTEDFNGFDVVIHLAGEPLTLSRWNQKKREKIYRSRIDSTKFLSEIFTSVLNPPKLFFSASAIGYYGDRQEEILTEERGAGNGFLSHVCQDWERASEKMKESGIRVVAGRFGLVLGPNGGALAKMLLPFRLGLGAKLGSGEQWLSWIALNDLIRGIEHIINHNHISGPVNLVSPKPLRQKEYVSLLAQCLNRPVFFRAPSFALHLIFGEVADEMLLASARVEPAKLLASNFSFDYPDLLSALRDAL